MNAIEWWNNLDQLGYTVIGALLSVLWQSALLFLIMTPLAWAMRKRAAAVRHRLWLGALLLTPLLPLLTSAVNYAGLPQPPESIDPFEGAIELKHDDGESDGKQSYGGRGPAIQFSLNDFFPDDASREDLVLKGFRIYGSRYGSGYDPENTKLRVAVFSPGSQANAEYSIGHELFGDDAKWVDLS